ncbi:flagellar export protein FliJ [Pseudomonas nitritireducens]|uniref:Flagellar FliJ protein n=1 Tax=Pseudomonas nitroreducens TaxID=46680 RepID=A0A7W7KN36_PSENT|nr:flagellar export protein FliJ [Pseudomonas nitritireducens]MBB4865395.1 flagellar export protein FliJ [Pseudomonas nitritireducens]
MTNNKNALDLIIEQSRELVERATNRLANSQRNQQEAANSVTQLLEYRTQYLDEMQRMMRAGMDAISAQNYRTFMKALDRAIEEARQAYLSSSKDVEVKQDEWRGEYRELKSREMLQGRRIEKARVQESRREQKAADEICGQMFTRRATAFGLN